jgi:hypothetical protein
MSHSLDQIRSCTDSPSVLIRTQKDSRTYAVICFWRTVHYEASAQVYSGRTMASMYRKCLDQISRHPSKTALTLYVFSIDTIPGRRLYLRMYNGMIGIHSSRDYIEWLRYHRHTPGIVDAHRCKFPRPRCARDNMFECTANLSTSERRSAYNTHACPQFLLRHSVLRSDLVGLAAIWRGWLDPICFGGGSTDLIGGAEWILKLWSS